MKITVLYLHDSTACWTLWRGRRLLQVFCEPVTQDMAERAAVATKKEGIQSACPWLSARSPKVRLLIDPVVDQTQSIPAFDYGFLESKSSFGTLKNIVERMYLTCRSLTSDVLADDLTRYRRDQLSQFPKALLQWIPPNAATKNNARLSSVPASWLITESGTPDFVLDWLHAMSGHGIEIIDVRPVSEIFSKEDAKYGCPVVTVWAEPRRWRLLVTANGYLEKTEQWSSEIQARIALDDVVSTMKDHGCIFKARYIGEITDLEEWQKIVPDNEFLPRENSIHTQSRFCALAVNSLPSGFCDLPLNSVLQTVSNARFRLWSKTAYIDLGVSIQRLLLKTRWRRRYLRSLVATTVAATFSGYFVLLASMHALQVVELHGRVNSELQLLRGRRALIDERAASLHSDPLSAAASIERMNQHELRVSVNKQAFLSELSDLLDERPSITLNGVSWRSMQVPAFINTSSENKPSVEALIDIKELVDTPLNTNNALEVEDFILLSGQVLLEQNQQKASDTLISFLNALTATEHVIDVIPVTHSLSLTQALNLPSDARLLSDDPSAFVVAVRLSV